MSSKQPDSEPEDLVEEDYEGRIQDLLGIVWDNKATDLLLTVGVPPLMRVDGQLGQVEDQDVLDEPAVEGMISTLLDDAEMTHYETRHEHDFAFSWGDVARFRGNAFFQRSMPALSLRMIPFEIPPFDDLGLPKVVQEMVDLPSGLILVTGPTGAGKSTTMASMIDYVNETRRSHILTIEDPIEYVFQHKQCAVNQREVGEDTESFGRGLRSALREDPDVLMVGEMRDLESIDIVLTMAETGHLVFATLHTNDTAQALDRLIGVYPGERQDQIRMQLSACLSGVIYQRLIPRIGGGLVAAYEVLVGTHAVRNLVREAKTRQLRNSITMGQSDGMQTLEMDLSRLVLDGIIDYEDAISRSLYPKEIEKPPPPPVEEAPKGRHGAQPAHVPPPGAGHVAESDRATPETVGAGAAPDRSKSRWGRGIR